MSAGILNNEWFTDPPWEKVSLWWLTNYIRRVRTDPRILQDMLTNRVQFEVVPIPVAVIRHLATAEVDAGSLPELPPIDAEPIVRTVQSFADAIEAGDVEAALTHVSRDYFDVAERDRDQLRADLVSLLDSVRGLRTQLRRPEELAQIGDQVVARFDAEWRAEDDRAERSRIELFLSRYDDGDGGTAWRIESVRTI